MLASLATTDWAVETLDLASSEDRSLAAHATSLGAALFYNFGNFCAVAAPPPPESVQRVNLLKGRPINQVGRITTTRGCFERCFAWELVPERSTATACSHSWTTSSSSARWASAARRPTA